MAMMDREGYINEALRQHNPQTPQPPTAPASAPEAPAAPPAGGAPDTPTGAGGSEPPPSSAGGEMPRSYPVPPVPPPPAPGPRFSIAGSGGGGATSFARPGTEAAKPFRSQLFATNRQTAPGASGAKPMARFGAGTAITGGGGAATSFLPAGLEGDIGGGSGGNSADELARILAALKGAGGQ